MSRVVIPRDQHCISRRDISNNALKVLNRLDSAGYQAFLVGGGVRDLLLKHRPKDFDIATDSIPEKARKLFRNSCLIGRRFRLLHVFFGKEVIEVATFRSENSGQIKNKNSSMIWRDNHYGTLEEDAFRRDFTVNALYYNIADFSVVDFHGGMQDIASKQIRMIGDPAVRYAEDPVRILRAIRFATKLDFDIEAGTAAPIADHAKHLLEVPPSRLFEEYIKLFHGGCAEKNFKYLCDYNILPILFPSVSSIIKQNPKAHDLIISYLKNTDSRVQAFQSVNPAFLLAALLWPILCHKVSDDLKEGLHYYTVLDKRIREVISDQLAVLSIPKKLVLFIKDIWFLQNRLEKRQASKVTQLLASPRFRAAYDFLLIRAEQGDIDPLLAEWWTDFQSASTEKRSQLIKQLPPNKKNHRKRRRAKH